MDSNTEMNNKIEMGNDGEMDENGTDNNEKMDDE